jgi:hypothetical protein
MHSHWSTRVNQSPTNLSFALVIEKAAGFRDSVMTLLREHGWLVHGISRAEEAFNILAHIPYGLIVLDAELLGTGGIDFVRFVRADWTPGIYQLGFARPWTNSCELVAGRLLSFEGIGIANAGFPAKFTATVFCRFSICAAKSGVIETLSGRFCRVGKR